MMKRTTSLLLAFLFAICVPLTHPARAAEPASIAMTTDVQGTAWLVDGAKQTRLGVMSYLSSGTKLRIDAGARVSITYFATPREFALSGPADAIVEDDRVRMASGPAPALRNLDQNQVAAGQKFSARQRDRQTVATFEMKSFAPGSLQLRQPVDTRLLGAPEEFSWRPVQGGKNYRFRLSDAGGQVLYEVSSDARTLKLPGTVALRMGHAYSWSVEALGSSGLTQTASAGFSLLDESEARAISERLPAANASFSERLLYASLLENTGLKLAAATYWKVLASERPEDEMLQNLGNR